jgi:hypothetical protein
MWYFYAKLKVLNNLSGRRRIVFNKTTGLATWTSPRETDTNLIYQNISCYVRNPIFFALLAVDPH